MNYLKKLICNFGLQLEPKNMGVNTEIKIKGILDTKWKDWFEGLNISYKDGNTVLSGNLNDQAKLHGILNLIRDLNLTLISVETK